MKAIQVTNYGGPEVASVQSVDTPTKNKGEVLVRVVASSVNPVDIKHMTPGTVQEIEQFPMILGWDIAGVVMATDEDSTFQAGDRVLALHPQGSWQQVVSVQENQLLKLPDDIDFIHGASIPLGAVTALQALRKLKIKQGETLLVTGAMGSVGGYAIELAKQAKISVAGLVRNQEQKTTCEDLFDVTMYVSDESLPAFDTVFDTAGILDRTEILQPKGRLITVSDDKVSQDVEEHALWTEHNFVRTSQEDLQTIIALFSKGKLHSRIEAVYSLNEIQEALKHASQSGNNGKTIIVF
ncbi:oxidoreductase [Tetragenococcus halophilus subsp. flandriensis]|uniref:quinone oxidoreductase family protein n=1 Tax=Tetragenococcus halophilus TaxID=51669 RepID=UPI0023E9ACBE|nr:NADP-dependent oxidoreductase [Tetragenococcus halophilus]GMA08375.1 oxidoreductase [Tetragenococcus halophilus subsp. flandriensis]